MAQFKNMYKVELNNGIAPVVSLKQIYYADVEANRIGAIVTMNGQPFPLSGTCTGSAILADGSTVPMAGVIDGNQAYIDLDSSCYSVEGQIKIFVKITTGGVTTTLLAAVGTVQLTETDTVIDPGTIIPSVTALITAIEDAVESIPADYTALLETIAPLYANLTFPVKAGQWCWHSGVLYEANQDISTSENWTAAHWGTTTVGGSVSELKSALGDSFVSELVEIPLDVTWAKGSFNSSNGGNVTGAVTLRSSQFAPCNAVSVDSGYVYSIYVFDDNNNHAYVGMYNGNTTAPANNKVWLSGLTALPLYPGGYVIRVLLARDPLSSDIVPEEGAYFHAYNNGVRQTVSQTVSQLQTAVSGLNESVGEIGQTVGGLESSIDEIGAKTDEIEDMLSSETQVDFTGLLKVSSYIPATNKWASSTGYKCYLVPVPSGSSSVRIEGNEEYASIYALLTDNSHTTGTTPLFYADTKRVVMATEGVAEITLAPEITYLYFYATNGSDDHTPQKVVFYAFNKVPALEASIADIYDILSRKVTVDFADYVETKGTYIPSTNKWNNDSDYSCYIIPVPAHTYKVKIVNNGEQNSVYALLSDAARSNGTRPSYYNGTARVVMTGTPETEVVIEPGVKYMYFYSSNSGVSYLPAEVTFSVYSGGDDVADELRRLRKIVENSQLAITNGDLEDVPETRGVRQALRKIKQLTTIHWVPEAAVPNNVSNFAPGSTVTGIVYSSVKELSKFVGLEVSLRTFMTAVHNPYSLLYTENVNATRTRSDYGVTYYGDNANAYYGMVCSSLVFYGLGIDVNWKTAQFQYLAKIGVLEKIYDQSADGLKLCDVQWIPGHTRIVTGIRRNEYGDVTEVQLSEAFNTNMRVKWWTASEVNGWTNDIWYRYTELYKNLDYTPSPFVAVPGDPELPAYQYNDDICTFAGDYAAFAVGDMVYLTYTKGAYTSLEIYKDDALIETIALSSIPEHKTDITSLMATNGYGNYKARLTDGANASGYCYWQMIDCNVSVTNNDGVLTVDFSSHNGKPHYCSIIDRSGTDLATYVFSDADKSLGQAVFNAHKVRYEQYTTETFVETAYIIVLFKGEYGTVRNGWLDTGLYSE